MKKYPLVLLAVCMFFTVWGQNFEERKVTRFLTITNLTKNQTFSPPVVVIHGPDYDLFQPGQASSPGLASLAEEGQTDVLVTAAGEHAEVEEIILGTDPIPPGQSLTLTINTKNDRRHVSIAARLLSSNDGFMAAKIRLAADGGTTAPDPTPIDTLAYAYDAGSEANTESRQHFADGSEGGADVRVTEGAEGFVFIHNGIQGVADLDTHTYSWKGPVAGIGIQLDPPDQQSFTMNLNLDLQQPGAVLVQEPGMCEGGFMKAVFTYSKLANFVKADVSFEGLPYKFSYTRPDVDPAFSPFSISSTPLNRYPEAIEEGVWEFWLANRAAGQRATYWYDAGGKLAGNEFDIDAAPIAGFSQEFSIIGQFFGAKTFEANPDGSGRVRFKWDYDQMLDERGTAGVLSALVPFDLNDQSQIGIYLSNRGLPVEQALSWDDILAAMSNGLGLQVFTVFTPNPKPEYMRFRPNDWPGWQGFQPPQPLSDAFLNSPCGTRVLPPLAILGLTPR